MATTILIASAGGHLEELRLLQPRLRTRALLWVTYDVPHARSTLHPEPLIPAHYPTTRNLPNALRNYRLARQVFAENDVDRVISTGAAVAVPFMVRARQLGIPCHYVESATRVTGPSISGRVLQRLQGVHLYRQLGDWGEPRWAQGPCVFDGFSVARDEVRTVEQVVVSLGTHRYQFPALIDRLATFFRGSSTDVLWQLGSTRDPGDLPGRAVTMIPPHELCSAIARADVVVGHAGVGLTLTALQAGTVPVLIPRRRSHREHTDDHQIQFARLLNRLGLAVSADVDELSPEHLQLAASRRATYREPSSFHLNG